VQSKEDTMTAPSPRSATPLPERFNFAAHLIERNAMRAGKVAYIDDQGSMTYGELADRVRRFASALGGLGVRREERVLLLMQDCNDWPVAFLGALYAGVVPVAVNTLLTADDYAYMLTHSRAQVAIVSPALMPVLLSARERCKHELKTLIVSGARSCRRFDEERSVNHRTNDNTRQHWRRRARFLVVFVRLHGTPQRDRSYPRQSLLDSGTLR
jgi:acyl-CoA synthetase (AMP-forming)/AMP-acid ligase II